MKSRAPRKEPDPAKLEAFVQESHQYENPTAAAPKQAPAATPVQAPKTALVKWDGPELPLRLAALAERTYRSQARTLLMAIEAGLEVLERRTQDEV